MQNSLLRVSFLSPLETSKSFRRVLVWGHGGYLLLAGFSENFWERSDRNFQKKLVAKGKSPTCVEGLGDDIPVSYMNRGKSSPVSQCLDTPPYPV